MCIRDSFIPDEDASEPAEAASFTLLKEQLVDVLSTLTPREEKVLKLRFEMCIRDSLRTGGADPSVKGRQKGREKSQDNFLKK